VLPQTPTPQNPTISARWVLEACKAGDPQTFTISARPHSQACTGLHDLHCAGPCPQGLPSRRYTHTHDLHSAGPCPPDLHRLAEYPLYHPMPLRPAKLGIHTCKVSAPLGHAPKPAQACTISTPLGHTPQTCTGLHYLHWAAPLAHAQAFTISAMTMPLKPAKQAIHRHTGSPFLQTTHFRHARPMLQRPASSHQLKASTRRPVGPHPPATCHRRAPNLPKRHTETSPDAKGVTSDKLSWQFCCSRTGVLFFSFFFNSF
jgi:hypothetical protein